MITTGFLLVSCLCFWLSHIHRKTHRGRFATLFVLSSAMIIATDDGRAEPVLVAQGGPARMSPAIGNNLVISRDASLPIRVDQKTRLTPITGNDFYMPVRSQYQIDAAYRLAQKILDDAREDRRKKESGKDD